MDFDAIGGNALFIVAIIGLVLLQFFFIRRRKPETTHREIVQNLLSEVGLNQALVETSHLREKPKKFAMTGWQINKNKLDFLDQSLQVVLSDAFMMAEDFNRQIEATKKHKSASFIINPNMGRLKEPLAKSREGLEQWLLSKVGTTEPPLKYPSIFDTLFGGR